MKVLQIVQKSQLRGAEMFASQLSNHLLEEGHEVHMISLFPGNAVLPFAGKLTAMNRPLNKRFIDVSGWRQLARYINEFKPDVVQANSGDTLKFVVLSKVIFRWKATVIFRNANKVSEFIDSWLKRMFNKFLMSQLDHVISVSELCRLDFIDTYEYQPGKTTMVPIGIELRSVNPSLPPDLNSIFAHGKILVHVGSFVPEKNHEGILRIFEGLLRKDIDVKLVLIGEGKLRPQIEQQIIEKKLSDHVFPLGYRNDVLSIVSNAQVLILPSRIEGLPGVILEAMFCRTSVVAYDVGGISEVVKQGENGWLVKAGDEEGFVAAVDEALHGSNLEIIRENAFNKVVAEFDNRNITRRFLSVYRKEKLTILQLIERNQLRGAEVFAGQLSNYLLAKGHDTKVISLFTGDAKLPFRGKILDLNRQVSKRFIDIEGWRRFARYVREMRVDVVQANAGDTLKFAVLSKLLFRWKACIVYRNASKASDYIDSWPKLMFNRFLMTRVQHVISVSEVCLQDFIKTYSFSPENITMIPIGIELQPVDTHLPDDLKAIFADGKVLVHVGGFTFEKNHIGLIRIVEKLLSKGEDIKLVLIGDGKLRSSIEEIIADKKLSDRIFSLGSRNDVLSIVKSAYGFILPSKIEGLPGVILEAMYCRTPVVAYDVGGVSEVVKNGETGWMVKAGDEDGFVAAIEELLHSNELDQMVERAFKFVVNEYDNRLIADRFLEVYWCVVKPVL